MSHVLSTQSEDADNVVFTCDVCSAVIGFNKPHVGEPCPTQDLAGTWIPPENPEQWMGPCTS